MSNRFVVMHAQMQRANKMFRALYEMQLWTQLIEIHHDELAAECDGCKRQLGNQMGHVCLGYGYEYVAYEAADKFIVRAVHEIDTERLRKRFYTWVEYKMDLEDDIKFLFDTFLLNERTEYFYPHYLDVRFYKYRPPLMSAVCPSDVFEKRFDAYPDEIDITVLNSLE